MGVTNSNKVINADRIDGISAGYEDHDPAGAPV